MKLAFVLVLDTVKYLYLEVQRHINGIMILKEHLHTQECIPLIREYRKCHKEHSIQKFFGICNQIEARMKICLNEELKMKARMNKHMKGPGRPNKIEREVREREVE